MHRKFFEYQQNQLLLTLEFDKPLHTPQVQEVNKDSLIGALCLYTATSSCFDCILQGPVRVAAGNESNQWLKQVTENNRVSQTAQI